MAQLDIVQGTIHICKLNNDRSEMQGLCKVEKYDWKTWHCKHHVHTSCSAAWAQGTAIIKSWKLLSNRSVCMSVSCMLHTFLKYRDHYTSNIIVAAPMQCCNYGSSCSTIYIRKCQFLLSVLSEFDF